MSSIYGAPLQRAVSPAISTASTDSKFFKKVTDRLANTPSSQKAHQALKDHDVPQSMITRWMLAARRALAVQRPPDELKAEMSTAYAHMRSILPRPKAEDYTVFSGHNSPAALAEAGINIPQDEDPVVTVARRVQDAALYPIRQRHFPAGTDPISAMKSAAQSDSVYFDTHHLKNYRPAAWKEVEKMLDKPPSSSSNADLWRESVEELNQGNQR